MGVVFGDLEHGFVERREAIVAESVVDAVKRPGYVAVTEAETIGKPKRYPTKPKRQLVGQQIADSPVVSGLQMSRLNISALATFVLTQLLALKIRI